MTVLGLPAALAEANTTIERVRAVAGELEATTDGHATPYLTHMVDQAMKAHPDPRRVETAEELDALPADTVIRAERLVPGRRRTVPAYFERRGKEWTEMEPCGPQRRRGNLPQQRRSSPVRRHDHRPVDTRGGAVMVPICTGCGIDYDYITTEEY